MLYIISGSPLSSNLQQTHTTCRKSGNLSNQQCFTVTFSLNPPLIKFLYSPKIISSRIDRSFLTDDQTNLSFENWIKEADKRKSRRCLASLFAGWSISARIDWNEGRNWEWILKNGFLSFCGLTLSNLCFLKFVLILWTFWSFKNPIWSLFCFYF